MHSPPLESQSGQADAVPGEPALVRDGSGVGGKLYEGILGPQHREANLKLVLDAAPALIGYWDSGLINRLANRAYAQYLAFAPEEILGKSMREVLPPEVFARNLPMIEAALRGEPQNFESPLHRRDDPHRVRQGQVLYVPDLQDGEVRGFVSMVIDITAIRMAEAKVAESERRYRHALEIGKVGTFEHELADAPYVLDAQAQIHFGAPCERLAFGQLLALVHPEDRAQVQRDIQQPEQRPPAPAAGTGPQAAHGQICKTEFRVPGAGGVRNLEMFSELLFESDGFKPYPRKLVAAVVDVTEHKQIEAQIRKLAFFDALTGLPNRRLLQERLQQAQTRHVRHRTWGAVLFIDLDKFKLVNDTLGHEIGDLLLVQVAQRLSACCRESDTVGRLGGDEFLVLLEDVAKSRDEVVANVTRVGASILQSLNEPYVLGPHRHHNTPSIGGAVFKGVDVSLDQLIKQADLAMYRAKAAGRNTLRIFDPTLDVPNAAPGTGAP